ncbi:MAG TPA: DUF3011 domain-containing protein, partial [Thermoanaerobaculia bacterium]|nr:DUF3011 domain-containing protein [Thermoanaerobaculia bacterium]
MKRNLFVLLILAVMTLIPTLASADETVRCESRGRRERCSYETRGIPRVLHQLSTASCVKGETWGFDDGVIWVERGCRADFVIERRHSREDLTIVCESSGRRHRCDVDVPFGVRLSRQLGRRDCIRGTTWGFDRDGIWVTDGCRGEFLVEGSEGRREGE